jgi:predicted AlkP superfamily phosphohydrolase/phosphomutase/tetratricopeptide (TPR) repeat protein
MPVTHPPKFLLIGWDAADWRIIQPLMARGEMPVLQKLLARSSHGPIRTLQPVLSPMLWTSIATGKRAWKHGIHGFVEPRPSGHGVRPITVLSRKAKALWNILNQNGHRCNVVGWWPSHPAEPLDGAMITNHYHVARTAPGAPWPVPPGAVHPARLAPHLEKLRLHPSDLSAAHILPFAPRAAEINQDKDKRLVGVARTIAECVNIQAAATGLLQNEPCDFMAVYFDAIDHFCHGFMRYHPPRQPSVSERDFVLYSGVIEGAYKFHDLMLGALLNMVGENCSVLILSDHGFHPDHLRPRHLPNEPAGPAAEHGSHGIFVLRAPGVAPGRRVSGITLLDIAPTVLHCFGLPAGRDMDGRVLVELFEPLPEPRFVDSWENIAGPHADGRHPPDSEREVEQDAAVLAQLAALGYIAPPKSDPRAAAQEALDELDFNLARAYLDGGHAREALALFHALWEKHPLINRFGLGVVRCRLALEQFAEARAAFETVKQRKREDAAVAAKEWEEFSAMLKAKGENHQPDEKESYKIRELRARALTHEANLKRLEAILLRAEDRHAEALAMIDRLSPALAEEPAYHLLRGEILLDLKDFTAAENAFSAALKLDPGSAEAEVGLARVGLGQRRASDAVGHALQATQLMPHFPLAHFTLGVSLHRLGRFVFAKQALQLAVRQNPNYVMAHQRLALIFERRLRKPELAARHREAAAEARRRLRHLRNERGLPPHPRLADPPPVVEPASDGAPAMPMRPPPKGLAAAWPTEEIVTIVAGLPRAGTSLVMQMLAAGGLAALTDGRRAADENNPRGYFEFEKVKLLPGDASWLPEARGKVVKIIAQLLRGLPDNHNYQIVFVERDLDEVLDSQAAMLARAAAPAAADRAALREAYARQLAGITTWLAGRANMDILYLRHAELVHDSLNTAGKLNQFFGNRLNVAAMAAVVTPALHRNRRPIKS